MRAGDGLDLRLLIFIRVGVDELQLKLQFRLACHRFDSSRDSFHDEYAASASSADLRAPRESRGNGKTVSHTIDRATLVQQHTMSKCTTTTSSTTVEWPTGGLAG